MAQLIVAAVAWSAVLLGANAATAGFVFLILILAIGVSTNLATSLISSLIAALFYNYFFFPPVGALTIHETENWVALISFLIASVIATRLVLQARTQAGEAEARRKEIEALYSLSVDLFSAADPVDVVGDAARRILTNFGATGGGLILFGTDVYDQRVVTWTGPQPEELDHRVAAAGWTRQALEISAPKGRDVYLPVAVSGRLTGILSVRGTSVTLRTLESAAMLLALAMERERHAAERSHIQALE